MEARDEFFHVPSDDEYWSESHYLDFVSDELQGHLRIGFYPNRSEANLFCFLLDDAVNAVVEPSIDLDGVHGLSVRRDDWRFAMTPRSMGRSWTVEFAGEMVRSGTAAEAARGVGSAVDVDFSFTTRGRHEAFSYSEGRDDVWGTGEDRYEQATRVDGRATIAGRYREFEGPGERDHSWGVRDWTDGEWLWISGGFEDGAAYNHLSAWPPGADPLIVNGFWFDGESVHPLTDATIEATPTFGPGTATDWLEDGHAPAVDLDLEWAEGEASITAEPFATTPVEWADADVGVRSIMNRSPSRQTRDGEVDGRGWFENMTQVPIE